MRRAKVRLMRLVRLLDAGASLNLTDPDGSTALLIAIINGHYDTAALLTEKGADPNIADASGMAALYAAVDMNTLGEVYGHPGAAIDRQIDRAGAHEGLVGAWSKSERTIEDHGYAARAHARRIHAG